MASYQKFLHFLRLHCLSGHKETEFHSISSSTPVWTRSSGTRPMQLHQRPPSGRCHPGASAGCVFRSHRPTTWTCCSATSPRDPYRYPGVHKESRHQRGVGPMAGLRFRQRVGPLHAPSLHASRRRVTPSERRRCVTTCTAQGRPDTCWDSRVHELAHMKRAPSAHTL